MAKTLAELLAGEDMEGGENFCDSVYNFLKNQGKDLNLFTNSGFGVWSRSDTAKGLATLTYDNGNKNAGVAPSVGDAAVGATSGATGKVISYTTAGGAWADGDASGVFTLGAVTGTFQDNETVTFGGVETALVNGDATIGVRNDPCNNDSTGLWTDDGAGITLAFVAAEYTVTTNAGNQRAWIAAAALTAGKIYKIELDIKDGTAAGQDIEGYFDDGAAQYGRIEVTAAGWASVSWTFECATTTAAGLVGFRIPTSLAASNIEIRRFSCYEITPCCTAADNIGFDGWDKADITLDIYREHWGANARDGSFYSLRVVNSGAGDELAFPTGVHSLGEWYAQFQQRPVTIGAWVKASVASHCRALIQDSAASTYSSYHTGSGDWEWLEVTRVIDASASQILFKFQFAVAGAVDGSTIVYISQPMAVFGWSLGEGMYQPRLQEFIYTEIPISSNRYDALASQSDLAFTNVNLEADSDARLPKGARAILVHSGVADSGSGAAVEAGIYLRKDATFATMSYANSVAGKTNNIEIHSVGRQGLSANGDFDISFEATAGNTLDIDMFQYHGVQVN